MAYIRKALLICDTCGLEQNIKPDHEDPFYSSFHLEECGITDWLKVEENHLCPSCAKVYKDKRDEMQRELDKLAGIKRI